MRTRLFLICTILPLTAFSQTTQRPRITGIDHVSFYTTAPEGVKHLYADILGLQSAEPLESGGTVRYMSGTQWVGYSPAPDSKATDRMDHTAFTTEDVGALRSYLSAKGLKPGEIENRPDHSKSMFVSDPEGHRIEFVERAKGDSAP